MSLGIFSIRPALECSDGLKIPRFSPQPGSHFSYGHAGFGGPALNAGCFEPASERRPLSILSCNSTARALVSISACQSIGGTGSLAAPACAATLSAGVSLSLREGSPSDESMCCSVAGSRATAARRRVVSEAREIADFCTCTGSRDRSSGVIGNAKNVMSTTSAECPALRNITMISTTWTATTASVTAALRRPNVYSSKAEVRAICCGFIPERSAIRGGCGQKVSSPEGHRLAQTHLLSARTGYSRRSS